MPLHFTVGRILLPDVAYVRLFTMPASVAPEHIFLVLACSTTAALLQPHFQQFVTEKSVFFQGCFTYSAYIWLPWNDYSVLKDDQFQPLWQEQGHLSLDKVDQCLVQPDFENFCDKTSSASLGNLFQCLITASQKMSSLCAI